MQLKGQLSKGREISVFISALWRKPICFARVGESEREDDKKEKASGELAFKGGLIVVTTGKNLNFILGDSIN
ncbi:hypothetical protein A4G19_15330 [Pasteurellaceae bacterium Macca]|nr:hypothetical protein [Pasteurellaceae bacterium Macca]